MSTTRPNADDIARSKAIRVAGCLLSSYLASGSCDAEFTEAAGRVIGMIQTMETLDAPDGRSDRSTRDATRLDCVRWIMDHVPCIVGGGDEAEILLRDFSERMGVRRCTRQMKGLLGDSFTATDGRIYSLVASCPWFSDEEYDPVMQHWVVDGRVGLAVAHKMKGGSDWTETAYEARDGNDANTYEEILRFRRHDEIPVSYKHWDEASLATERLTQILDGKDARSARTYFQLAGAAEQIKQLATPKQNENERNDTSSIE